MSYTKFDIKSFNDNIDTLKFAIKKNEFDENKKKLEQ